MDKMKMQSKDRTQENFEKLAALFPNAVTETITGYDEDGNAIIERAIDKDVLQQEISAVVVEGRDERYQFTWPDKKKSILAANAPIRKTLRPCREESVDFDNTENLYIEGDNLDVLKLLQETYLGKVKMIYIDPPYNTGHDFVYNDDFKESTDEYMENSGQLDEEGNRLFQNTESNGRFHTDWLNMLYPRLKIARDLLSEDGVIFISIDDKENASVRKMADEIFGESNFVSNIIWQSRTSISNDYEISLNHNHTLIYSKNREELVFGGDPIDSSDYINPDNDVRGPWKLVPLDANHIGGDTIYPITNPKTGIDYYPPNGRIWCYNRNTMQKLLNEGRIKFGLNDDSAPKRKLYYKERLAKGDKKTPSSILLDAGTTKDGTVEIMKLFDGKKVFDYPKPVSLINRLIKYGAPDGGIVMDFFSGSGTTAQAVIETAYSTNKAYSFILVQIPEDLDYSLKYASPSAKATIKEAINLLDSLGKLHYLSELAKERIKRFVNDIKDSDNSINGFRVLKLDSTNMKDVYYNPHDVQMSILDNLESNIKEDRTPEDLLFQVMLDLGVLLSSKIEESTIAGKKVFNVADNFLIACFDEDVSDETITAVAKLQPAYFVMRDSSMKNDSVATNFDQIFATYSPDTVRKVI